MILPYTLLRRAEKKYIERLYSHGQIYMNTVKYFRDCDNVKGRVDREEGAFTREYLLDIEMSVCDVGQVMEEHGRIFGEATLP